MIRKTHACDHCGKDCPKEPAFGAKGWLQIDKLDLILSTGEAYQRVLDISLDFCNPLCLANWIDAMGSK